MGVSMDNDMDSLPDGVTREALHRRQIDFQGFRRSDGLFEIHGHITDRKTHAFALPSSDRTVPAGSPIHDMRIIIVFDAEMIIREVRTNISAYPYSPCPGGGDSLQALIGARIGRGWNNEVRNRLPACDTCTHLREMLAPLASAAFQTMTSLYAARRRDEGEGSGPPMKVDSCYAYGASRDLVKRLWPEFYKP